MNDAPISNDGGGIIDIIFSLVLFAILLFIFIFWLKMLLHAIRSNLNDKLIWVLVILLLGPLGAIIYYFVVKRKTG